MTGNQFLKRLADLVYETSNGRGDMTSRTKWILSVVGGLFLFGVCTVSVIAYSLLSHRSSHNQASAMECVLLWGQLAPFPKSAQEVMVTPSGSPLTRTFHATFMAAPKDIEDWLTRSSGIRSAERSTPAPGIRHFKITPGGGAQHAEATIDDNTHRIKIVVDWS